MGKGSPQWSFVVLFQILLKLFLVPREPKVRELL